MVQQLIRAEMIAWLDVTAITPHPDNPRLFMREEVVNSIASSIATKGFDPCYAVLVRPYEGSYQMISGHHRLAACDRAGVLQIPAWVREMSDEEAYFELVRGNNQGELKPLEIGLHALSYCDTKSVIGQGQGVKGDIGLYADAIGRSRKSVSELKAAATVYDLIGARAPIKSLNDLASKSKHLCRVASAPESDGEWLVEELLKNEWSERDTQAAVKAINEVSQIPDRFHLWLPPDKWKREAIKDLDAAKRINRWVATAQSCFDKLDDSRPVWRFGDDNQPFREILSPKRLFLDRLPGMGQPSDVRINNIYSQVLNEFAAADKAYDQWVAAQNSEEEARRQREEAQRKLAAMIAKFSPIGHCADIRNVNLEPETFDAVITDCPYLLSNGGTTVRSGREVLVDKNFADTDGKAISPEEWIPIVWDALVPGGTLVTTCSKHILFRLHAAAEAQGAMHVYELIWHVTNPTPLASAHMPQPAHEYIFVAVKNGSRYYRGREEHQLRFDETDTSVISLPKCGGHERLIQKDGASVHDTQKPLELYERLITLYCPPEGRILDPFAGTGTTAVAAKHLGRRCDWVELEPRFFEVALDRIEETPFHWEN